jgi:hypothetical protein
MLSRGAGGGDPEVGLGPGETRAMRRTLARRGLCRRRRACALCVPYTRPFEPVSDGPRRGFRKLSRAK